MSDIKVRVWVDGKELDLTPIIRKSLENRARRKIAEAAKEATA